MKKSVVVAALFASTSAYASSGWTVSEASGSVTVTRGDQVISARKSTKLRAGDVVRTGKSSRAVLVRGKEYVVVSPKAHIRIAEPKKTGAVTQIFQYLGNVLFKIEKKSTPHFGVETPYMAAVVKGTTFNVSVTDEGTSVQVTEGAVEVSTGDDLEAALLTPGLVGLVEADDAGELIVISGQDEAAAERAIVRGQPSFVTQLRDTPGRPETSDISVGADRSQANRNAAVISSDRVGTVAAIEVPAAPANENANFGAASADAANGANRSNSPDFAAEEQDFALIDDDENEENDERGNSENRRNDGEAQEEEEELEDLDEKELVEDTEEPKDESDEPVDGELDDDQGEDLETDDLDGDDLGDDQGEDDAAEDELDDDQGDDDDLVGAVENGQSDDAEEDDLVEDLGLGDDDDDDSKGQNNGKAYGKGKGKGNGKGNQGNGNGNGGPASDLTDDHDDDDREDDDEETGEDRDTSVGIGLGLAIGNDADGDMMSDLGLGRPDDDADEDDVDDRPGRGRGRGRSNIRN